MKKTKWFAKSMKPAHKGVYQTRTGPSESGEWFQYWDGNAWRATGTTVARAFSVRRATSGSFCAVEWRGLTEQAE